MPLYPPALKIAKQQPRLVPPSPGRVKSLLEKPLELALEGS